MTEQEKDELFADFMVRMAEMDKDDKRLAVAKNNSAMKELTEYYAEIVDRHSGRKTDKNAWLYRQDETGWWYFAADGLYDAYSAIRKVVPYAVGVKRALNNERPRFKNEGYRKQYVLDPEKDREEATKIGKMLIDAMVRYLKEEE